MINEIKRDRK